MKKFQLIRSNAEHVQLHIWQLVADGTGDKLFYPIY